MALTPEQIEARKQCTRCGIENPLSNFHREKSHSDGHRSMCKKCDAIRHAKRSERIAAAEGRQYRPAIRFSKETLHHFISKKENGCWEWSGRRNPDGYGNLKFRGENRAHRASWRLFKGEIPDGLCVLHKCDNPPCINPDHLFLGTQVENMQDMVSKGRAAKGEGSGVHKLTASEVIVAIDMRQSGKTFKAIAAHFGVDEKTMWHAIKGRTWRHVRCSLPSKENFVAA